MLIKFRNFTTHPVYTHGLPPPMTGLRKLDVIKISYQGALDLEPFAVFGSGNVMI
jgi:hypothetical protein